MNRYALTRIYDIQALYPGQILYYETTDELFTVDKVTPIYAGLKPINPKSEKCSNMRIKDLFVSNQYITEYFLLPRT